MPVISLTLVTRRAPSGSLCTCTTSVIAEAIWLRMAPSVMGVPAMPTICSSRLSASRGEFAWTVVIDPSWPVFIACSMSNASSPRHSPMMMRSGAF